MMPLSNDKQADIIDAFNTTSRYLDDILNINNVYFDKIYDKRDDFDFKIVNFPFLDGDAPCSTFYGVCISQLSRLLEQQAMLLNSILAINS